FAYVFYATDDAYACSALVNIDRLQKRGVKYPIYALVTDTLSQNYVAALRSKNVFISPQKAPPLPPGSNKYYKDCLVKLLAFKMYQINPHLKRVIIMDSDQLVYKNVDHLFDGLPAVDLAAPRAYWLSKEIISSTFMVISPSERVWRIVEKAMANIPVGKYDMDVVNDLFGDKVLMLPGEYVTINSLWKQWKVPAWFRDVDPNSSEPSELDDLRPARIRDKYEEMKQIDVESSAGSNLKQNGTVQSNPALHNEKLKDPKEKRPNFQTLNRVFKQAEVLHFFELGKPWSFTVKQAQEKRPDAHPIFYQIFKQWRTDALRVCP
ncbi:glycosyltransferase family 8 protein, partial [Myriangium duriaei CBS 260.36]